MDQDSSDDFINLADQNEFQGFIGEFKSLKEAFNEFVHPPLHSMGGVVHIKFDDASDDIVLGLGLFELLGIVPNEGIMGGDYLDTGDFCKTATHKNLELLAELGFLEEREKGVYHLTPKISAALYAVQWSFATDASGYQPALPKINITIAQNVIDAARKKSELEPIVSATSLGGLAKLIESIAKNTPPPLVTPYISLEEALRQAKKPPEGYRGGIVRIRGQGFEPINSGRIQKDGSRTIRTKIPERIGMGYLPFLEGLLSGSLEFSDNEWGRYEKQRNYYLDIGVIECREGKFVLTSNARNAEYSIVWYKVGR